MIYTYLLIFILSVNNVVSFKIKEFTNYNDCVSFINEVQQYDELNKYITNFDSLECTLNTKI